MKEEQALDRSRGVGAFWEGFKKHREAQRKIISNVLFRAYKSWEKREMARNEARKVNTDDQTCRCL